MPKKTSEMPSYNSEREPAEWGTSRNRKVVLENSIYRIYPYPWSLGTERSRKRWWLLWLKFKQNWNKLWNRYFPFCVHIGEEKKEINNLPTKFIISSITYDPSFDFEQKFSTYVNSSPAAIKQQRSSKKISSKKKYRNK